MRCVDAAGEASRLAGETSIAGAAQAARPRGPAGALSPLPLSILFLFSPNRRPLNHKHRDEKFEKAEGVGAK